MCRDHEATCPQMHVYNYSRHWGRFATSNMLKSPPQKSSIFRLKTHRFLKLFVKSAFFVLVYKLTSRNTAMLARKKLHTVTARWRLAKTQSVVGCLSRLNFEKLISKSKHKPNTIGNHACTWAMVIRPSRASLIVSASLTDFYYIIRLRVHSKASVPVVNLRRKRANSTVAASRMNAAII